MKKLIAIGLLTTTLAFADAGASTEAETTKQAAVTETEAVKASHAYLSLGLGPFPIPLPLFAVGGRFQNGHHGADISLQGISFGSNLTILKENIDYVHYFKPRIASQFYMGIGASVTEVISHKKCNTLLSPQVLIGKQYTNDDGDVRFFQAQVEPVFLKLNNVHKNRSWGTFPAVIISYGICF